MTALLINRTDYLAIGLTWDCARALLVYVIFEKLYGGFAVDDPEGCPVNRAGLAVGDSARIGVSMFLAGAMRRFWGSSG